MKLYTESNYDSNSMVFNRVSAQLSPAELLLIYIYLFKNDKTKRSNIDKIKLILQEKAD